MNCNKISPSLLEEKFGKLKCEVVEMRSKDEYSRFAIFPSSFYNVSRDDIALVCKDVLEEFFTFELEKYDGANIYMLKYKRKKERTIDQTLRSHSAQLFNDTSDAREENFVFKVIADTHLDLSIFDLYAAALTKIHLLENNNKAMRNVLSNFADMIDDHLDNN